MKEREKRKNSRYITGAVLGLVILAVLGLPDTKLHAVVPCTACMCDGLSP